MGSVWIVDRFRQPGRESVGAAVPGRARSRADGQDAGARALSRQEVVGLRDDGAR